MSGEDGTVVFDRLSPSESQYHVNARTESGEFSQFTSGGTQVREGETSDCVVVLPEQLPGRVWGRVVGEDGAPMAGVNVTVRHSLRPDSPRLVETDETGRYESVLHEGRSSVEVHLPRGYAVSGGASREVIVTAPGQEAREDFVLERAEPVVTEVRLVNALDEPVTRALVTGWPIVGAQAWLSSEEGQFVVESERVRFSAYDPTTNAVGGVQEHSGGGDLVIRLDGVAGANRRGSGGHIGRAGGRGCCACVL